MSKNTFILGLLLVLALFLRIYQLDKVPYGFFCDEASIGYNAYRLLTSGKDEYGVKWPLFYKAFSEYKNPIMLYSTIPSVYLFGLNEFSVRLVSVIYGVAGVLAIYLLTKSLFSAEIGLLSSSFLTISPWHVHLSRVSLEGLMPFVFFTTMATFFWLQHLKKEKSLYFYLSILFFALSLYSYFPARIFIPFFTLGLFSLSIKKLLKNRQKLFSGIILTAILIVPLVLHTFWGPGLTRWYQVSSSKPLIKTVNLYLQHFSPTFLFLKGDIDFPGQFITRHSIRGLGEFYLFQLPLVFIGLIYIIKNKKLATGSILTCWLIFYPLGSSLTDVASPQATRSVIGVIPFQIISAAGLSFLFDLLKKRVKILSPVFFLITGLTILLSFSKFWIAFQNYPLYSSDYWGWQYGPRDIINFFKENQSQYNDLIMTGSFNGAYIFLNFYGKGQCQNCRIGDFGLYNSHRQQLFAFRPEEMPKTKKIAIKKQLFYPDGKLAFNIFEIK